MKISIQGVQKEINEAIQVIVSNQEHKTDTMLLYDSEIGESK